MQLKGEGLWVLKGRVYRLTSRIKSTVARMPEWQEPEATGHRASAVRKQREVSASAQFAFFFLCHPEPKLREQYCPSLLWVPHLGEPTQDAPSQAYLQAHLTEAIPRGFPESCFLDEACQVGNRH